jgi:predicted esterase
MKSHGIYGLFLSLSFGLLAADSDVIRPKNWKGLGPFLSAAQEGAIDQVFFQGGQSNLRPSDQSYPSALGKNGHVSWFRVRPKNDHFEVTYPDVDWELQQKLGGLSAIANQGYFYSELERENDEVLWVWTRAVGEFFINGKRYFGENYGASYNKVPVPFKKGLNSILLKVSSFSDASFDFRLEKPTSDVEILDDLTLPDLISGATVGEIWAGIPLVNTTETWLRDLKIRIQDQKIFEPSVISIDYPLAPLSVLKTPLKLRQLLPLESENFFALKLEVFSGEKKLGEKTLSFRIRKPLEKESTLRTYLSKFDHSVQYFGLLYPKNFDANKTYDLILSLHGANVEASSQIEDYAPKDWAFVAAVTNRRPHGFAYQDLGRLEVLEALEHIQAHYKIRSGGVYLSGHSMGGQGVWHLGLHHPDRFAGLAPSAGWVSFKTYIPMHFQKAEFSASPAILAFRDRVLFDANHLFFLENLRTLPIFISQGSRDEVVPALHSRLFSTAAENKGFNVRYREVETSEHFWGPPYTENRGRNAIDAPEQYEFLRAHRTQGFPTSFSIKLNDLGIEKNFYWVRVEAQDRLFMETSLKAEILEKKILLQSQNIRMLSLRLSRDVFPHENVELEWNGNKLSSGLSSSRSLTIELTKAGIQVRKDFGASSSIQHSLKSAFFSPYGIVYGSLGSEGQTQELLHSAWLLSNRVWRTANGFAPIFSDQEIPESFLKSKNLILLGSPERNRITKRFSKSFPIRLTKNEVWLGAEKVQASKVGLSVAFVFPNPESRKNLVAVFEGSSPKAETFLNYFQPFFDRLGVGVPDFLVYSSDVQALGWGGVRAAGFFSEKWDLSNHDFAIRQ